jgi:hypothetical protein
MISRGALITGGFTTIQGETMASKKKSTKKSKAKSKTKSKRVAVKKQSKRKTARKRRAGTNVLRIPQ